MRARPRPNSVRRTHRSCSAGGAVGTGSGVGAAGAGFGAGFFFFFGTGFFIPFFLRTGAPRFAFLDFFAMSHPNRSTKIDQFVDFASGCQVTDGCGSPYLFGILARSHLRGRFHRPRRLRRNIAPDNAHPPDIRRGRRCALLRGEHAGRSTEDIYIRAQQCDAAIHLGGRGQGPSTGAY
jgi:hypothetical protein